MGLWFSELKWPNQIPAEYSFDESKASKGVILARDIAALAWQAPKELIQFTPYQLVSNVDDKACIYSGHQGDGTGDGISDEPGLVIVNEGVMNQGYDIHDGRDNSKALNGLKVRYTNNIYAGGQMGALFMQILGFSAEELPNAENGIICLEMEGLTPDGNLNPNSKAVGYVVLIRTWQSVETEMFRLYEEKVRKPSIDAIKEQLGLDPDDVEPWGRSVHISDGGVPQMTATKEKATLENSERR